MQTLFHYGDSVRLTRNVRNDGTYPGTEIGEMLVRRGNVGYVQNVGTFLQDQIIYSVHFIDINRLIGCREEELIRADEPWNPSVFEFRDKVTSTRILTVNNEVIANPGDTGEIVKVLANEGDGFQYHVRFPGHTLQVGEALLAPLEESGE
jgi:nitrogen fixation protein NifZ